MRRVEYAVHWEELVLGWQFDNKDERARIKPDAFLSSMALA
jgi:hypothetical protein